MIKYTESLASIRPEDICDKKINRKMFERKLQKIGREHNIHITMFQVKNEKPPARGSYRWLGDFVAESVIK